MRWSCDAARWLSVLHIALGVVALSVALAGAPVAAVPPDDLSTYQPEVQELLETTYLGHVAEFPDPGEPYVVLKKYLERDMHKYQTLKEDSAQIQELESRIGDWMGLVEAFPQSRHALVGLAQHYRIKAELSQDASWLRQAADFYIQAAEIGLAHGRIRYTRELSELLVALGDKTRLDQIFERILALPKELDYNYYYGALVDYADALARLDDEAKAWRYFEEAIDLHPENNIEAINRYTRHLLDKKQGQKAFEILDSRLTPPQRIRFRLPALFRKEAMELLGMDTASADEEIMIINKRSSESGLPRASSAPNAGVRPQGVHLEWSDDCRGRDYTTKFCSVWDGWCYYTFVVNLAEVLYNEARTESWGDVDTVGWTVRDRAYEEFSPRCDHYPGQNSPCTLNCNSPYYCDLSRRYCCAIHGGTISTGSPTIQFNDGHIPFSVLDLAGFANEAAMIIEGWVPEVSSHWAPPGTSSCDYSCNGPLCWYGYNYFSPAPRGPMEFKKNYSNPLITSCKWRRGLVCPNGGDNNYWWNRR